MSFEIKGELTSRKGCRVTYGSPLDVIKNNGSKTITGIVEDEVWLDEDVNKSKPHANPCEHGPNCWGDYSFCAQLIKWDETGMRDIRLAYYRRRCGEDVWRYASQTTVTTEPKNIKRLLELVLAKTEWFSEPNPKSYTSQPRQDHALK